MLSMQIWILLLPFFERFRYTNRTALAQQNVFPETQQGAIDNGCQPVDWLIFKNTTGYIGSSLEMLEQARSNIFCFGNVDTTGVIKYPIDTWLILVGCRNPGERKFMFDLFGKYHHGSPYSTM